MSVQVIRPAHAVLMTREDAARLRERVEVALRQGPVTLDFSEIETLSPGWIDEFFAVLAQRYGLSVFIGPARVRGLNEELALEVAEIVHHRLVQRAGRSSEEILAEAKALRAQFADKRSGEQHQHPDRGEDQGSDPTQGFAR